MGIDAAVGEILVGKRGRRGATDRNAVGQCQVVAACIAIHLERRIAEHVPAHAQTRRPLVATGHVGHTGIIEVGELVVANAQRQQQRIGDLPFVFEKIGFLFHRHAGRGIENGLIDEIAIAACRANAEPGPDRRGRARGTAIRPGVARAGGDHAFVACIEVHVVHTGGQGVGTQHILQIDPQTTRGVFAIPGLAGGLVVADFLAASDGRILQVRPGKTCCSTGIVAEVGLPALAVCRAQGQVIGDVAGVLADVVAVVDLDRIGEGAGGIATQAFVAQKVAVGAAFAVVVFDAGEFEDVAVVDVPVDLGVDLRLIDAVVVAANHRVVAARRRHTFAALLLGGHENEQAVFDQRAAGIHAVHRVPELVVLAAAVQAARQRWVAVFIPVWRRGRG